MTNPDNQSLRNEDLDQHLDAYTDGKVYDLDNRLILNDYPHRVLELIPQDRRGTILELGLGHGRTTGLYYKNFDRHVVIDGSPAIIQQFRDTHPEFDRLDIQEAYFENFDTSERFDVISMGFVLEHVDDPALVLNRFKKFLKPGGYIVITVPNGESLHRRLGNIAGLLPDMMALGAGDLKFGHKRVYSVDTLNALVANCGCFIDQMEGLFLKPLMTSQIEQLNLSEPLLQAMMTAGRPYPELCAAMLALVKCEQK